MPLLVALAVGSIAASADDAFMRVDEIVPGMKGYGKTVFSGTKIERFDIEVISVLKKAMVKGDLILIRMSGGPLAQSGIVAGMSGSPVYIGDKLIGAVAYGWTFAKEPIAGVTPIHEMLDVLDRKPPADVRAVSAEPHAPSGDAGGLKPILTPLMVSGAPMQLLNQFTPSLERWGMFPVQGGASAAAPGPPADLQPGSALGVQLMRGDIDMVAVGTLTYRKDKQILAFGHPMFQAGHVDLPMVEAYVHLTLSRQDRSYKLAGTRAMAGRVSRDFRSAIAGEIGRDASMIPCAVAVKSEATGKTHSYSYEMISNKFLTPMLIQIAILGSLGTTEAEMGDTMVDITTKLHLKDRPEPVSFQNTFFEEAVPYRGLLGVYQGAAAILQNEFAPLQINRVAVEASVSRGRRTATIETVWVDAAEALPGAPLHVVVGLRPYRATALVYTTVSVDMPATLPRGYPMKIIACDAQTSEFLARTLSPEAFRPNDVSQLIRLIQRQDKNIDLIVYALLPDTGMTARGELLPSLPSSFMNILGAYEPGNPDFAKGSLVVRTSTDWVLSGMQMATVVIGEKK